MPSLIVLAPGPLYLTEGQLRLPAKFESGMAKYAELFPGEVHVLGRPASEPDDDNLGGGDVTIEGLSFGVHVAEDLESGLRALGPDIALVSLSDDHAALVGIAGKTVFSAEHASRSWLAMSLAEPHSWLDRLRMEWGYRRLEKRMVQHVAQADGVHCNGVIAWRTYEEGAQDALRVYDSRVTTSMVEQAMAIPRSSRSGVLRLAFSGRLTAIKGPQHVIRLPALLEARGVHATVDIFGDGPMRATLESAAGPGVRFHGSIDFADWVHRIPREVDLMVLPHVQPDPSGTYLESAGMGVPIVGFSNEALVDLEKHGFAKSTDIWSSEGLADVIVRTAQEPGWLAHASRAGMNFMRAHSFDQDFETRVDNLLRIHRRIR